MEKKNPNTLEFRVHVLIKTLCTLYLGKNAFMQAFSRRAFASDQLNIQLKYDLRPKGCLATDTEYFVIDLLKNPVTYLDITIP